MGISILCLTRPRLGLLFLIAVAAFLLATGRGHGYSGSGEAEELVLYVRMNNIVFAQEMLAYQYRDDIFLPVIDLARSFDFYIEPGSDMQRISGWAVHEGNSFTIDIPRRELIHKGVRDALHDDDILPEAFSGPAEIYIRQGVLNRIWPVDLSVNMPALTLDIVADETLPFIQQQERLARRKTLSARLAAGAREDVVREYKPNPYRLIGPPAIDIESSANYGGVDRDFEKTLSVGGVMDMAFAQANFSATLNYRNREVEAPDAVRLRLERQAMPDAPLPMGINRIEAGDTRIRHSPAIANSSSGRGVFVSSSSNRRDGDFDVITIEGEGPAGWDIEIYLNNELIASGTVDERGEYRFEDISLGYGNNNIRKILYGPQGQMREESTNYMFGSDMMKPGDFSYTLGAVDDGQDLISFDRDRTKNRNDGVAASAQFAYGVSRNVTAFSTISTLPDSGSGAVSGVSRDYVTIGVVASTGIGALQTELYQDISRDPAVQNKGRALDMRFLTQMMGVRVNLRNIFYKDFESVGSGIGAREKKRESEIGAQRNFRLSFGHLGLNLNFRDTDYANGRRESELLTRQSLGFHGFRLSHQTRTELDDFSHRRSSGQLSATGRIRDLRLRSSLSYDLYPEKILNTFDGEARYRFTPRLSAALTGRYNFISDISGAGVQVNYDFDKVLAGVEGFWSDNDDFRLTLRASTALGPYGAGGRYAFMRERVGSLSPFESRVFVDKNGDGIFNEDDEPVPDAKILVNHVPGKERSNEDGVAVVRRSSGMLPATLSVDEASLFDPYFKPGHSGYKTVLRPGTMPVFDFPLIQTGAVEGTVWREGDQPLSGIVLELVDQKTGQAVAKTMSAYDGYYTFEFIPPGEYVVRVDRSEHDIAIEDVTVILGAEDIFASGIDLDYRSVEAPPEE